MNAEHYRKQLFHPRTDKFLILKQLKREGSYDQIRKIFRSISDIPIVKSVFASNIKPKDYSDIRKSKTVPFSGDFIGEMSFCLIELELHKNIVSKFIVLKAQFDREILIGNFNEAESILSQIEEVSGKSLWLVENQIILKELRDGVKANWNEVSDLSKKISDPFVLFLIENFSKKAESKISYFRYLNLFNNQIPDDIRKHVLFEYLCFRLNYLSVIGYSNLAYILSVESANAIVDRYLIFKQVLSEIFNPHLKDQRDVVKEFLDKAFSIFPNDPQLIQLSNILTPSLKIKIPVEKEISLFLESYSISDFDYCLQHAKELINKYPDVLEIYEIYAKSIVESGAEFQEEGLSHNIKVVLSILVDIYMNKSSLEQTLDTAYKITMTFFSSSWAKQFMSLVNAATSINNGNKHFNIQYVINSQIQNPRILYYLKNEERSNFAIFLKQEERLSKSVDIVLNIVNGNYDYFNNESSLSDIKKAIYYGRALMKAKKFEDAKIHYEKLYKLTFNNEVIREEVLVNLFRVYLKLNANKEACCLFVENYLKNIQCTKRLNKLKLLDSLERGDIEKVKDLIDLPIFYKITSTDSYQQYVAYDTYLSNLNFNRPLEFISSINRYSEKILYFLREVCTIEIMHYSYHFNGTDDIENERLQILNKLLVIDKENEDAYIKEITELNQNSNIRKAIREVNKGRITVNVNQLKISETNNIKEAFTRFQEIELYSKKENIIGIDSSINLLKEITTANIDDLIPNKVVYTSDPAFISFKVIFIEIRDKFILSKEYGLDGYLSTRIRHGTLLNHIRSVFESENIISQRDKNNNYLENDFWDKSIPYNLMDKRSKIQDAIKSFSRSIDEHTEFLIKELIQIKTEKYTKKPKALFDFTMSNQTLALIFSIVREKVKDHNAFLSFVFEYLQEVTEQLLSQIRIYINEQLKNSYNKILQDFNTEIKGIIEGGNYPELMHSIGLCGTKLQNELKNISEWFYLSNASKDMILDLNVLIQTSIQITNAISPNFRINPVVKEDVSLPMVGTVHLIYLCRILLDNIVLHSKLSPSDLNIEISSTQIEEDFLKISFKNNFSPEIDVVSLKQKLDDVKRKWDIASSDYENIDVEGGSGFEKIRRILAFDLSCDSYKFDYDISGNDLTISIYMHILTL